MPPHRKDRRTERNVLSRTLILAACKQLMLQGDFRPTVPVIAAASARSIRTVFHSFDSAEGLWLAALEDETFCGVLLSKAMADFVNVDILAGLGPWGRRQLCRMMVLGRIDGAEVYARPKSRTTQAMSDEVARVLRDAPLAERAAHPATPDGSPAPMRGDGLGKV